METPASGEKKPTIPFREKLSKWREAVQAKNAQNRKESLLTIAAIEREGAEACDDAMATLRDMLGKASTEWERQYLQKKLTSWQEKKERHLQEALWWEGRAAAQEVSVT